MFNLFWSSAFLVRFVSNEQRMIQPRALTLILHKKTYHWCKRPIAKLIESKVKMISFWPKIHCAFFRCFLPFFSLKAYFIDEFYKIDPDWYNSSLDTIGALPKFEQQINCSMSKTRHQKNSLEKVTVMGCKIQMDCFAGNKNFCGGSFGSNQFTNLIGYQPGGGLLGKKVMLAGYVRRLIIFFFNLLSLSKGYKNE